MAVLDEINQSRLGRVFLAWHGMHSAWSMKRDHLLLRTQLAGQTGLKCAEL